MCVCTDVCDSNPPVDRPNLKWRDEHSSKNETLPMTGKEADRLIMSKNYIDQN